jgi:hypothetical protein
MQALYLVRDYDRIKKEIAEIPYATHTGDGQPRGTDTSDPVGNAALRMEALGKRCEAIDQALHDVPSEYRRGVIDNIIYGGGFPIDAHYNTYSMWRCRFLYFVAKKANII